MATSGTVARTIIDVTSIIEHSVRRCGVLSSVITSEQQLSARDNLFLILANFANRGLSLWCVEKMVTTTIAGKAVYNLPKGVVDVLNINYRSNATQFPNTSSSVGDLGVDLGSELRIQSVAVVAGVGGDYELELAYSSDGVTWWPAALSTVTMSAGDQVCLDADPISLAQYWRIRDVSSVPKLLTTAVFYGECSSIPMSPLNRQDYTQLPNRAFSSDYPLQFWFDKQWDAPRLWLWPLPSTAGVQIEIWTQMMVQDPGAFTNQLAIPPRWLEATISALAPIVCLELPKELVAPERYDQLTARAEKALKEAEDGETDGAPIRWAPNISAYTR